jgi:hypothetical protein
MQLGGISKQGDRYLYAAARCRRHSGHSSHERQPTPMANWIRKLLVKKPFRVVSVALTNKLARIAWVVHSCRLASIRSSRHFGFSHRSPADHAVDRKRRPEELVLYRRPPPYSTGGRCARRSNSYSSATIQQQPARTYTPPGMNKSSQPQELPVVFHTIHDRAKMNSPRQTAPIPRLITLVRETAFAFGRLAGRTDRKGRIYIVPKSKPDRSKSEAKKSPSHIQCRTN